MGEVTTYLSNKVLDHVLGTATYTAPGGLYLGFMSAVSDGDAGSVTELTVANNYAREAITFGVAGAVTEKQMKNTVAIQFSCTTSNWATVTHFGVWDASTSGNLLWWGTMTNFTLEVGKTYTIAVSGLAVGLGDKFTNYAADEMLDHINGSAWTIPTATNLALFSTATSDAGGGTEVTGTGYARQDVNFASAASEATSNTAQIQFSASGADWTTATYAAIYDQSTNMLMHTAIGESWAVGNGETLTIATGDLDITLE